MNALSFRRDVLRPSQSQYVAGPFPKTAANTASWSFTDPRLAKAEQHERNRKPFKLYDMVVLRADTRYDGVTYPKGTAGAIVHVYEGKGAFEVEFSDPEPGVVALRSYDIGAL